MLRVARTIADLAASRMSLIELITVGVIDDNRLVRDGLAGLLNKLPNVRATACQSAEELDLMTAPRVGLLDVGVGGAESVRVAASLATRFPETKIIAMDLVPVNEEIAELANAGVSEFVMKDATFDEFRRDRLCGGFRRKGAASADVGIAIRANRQGSEDRKAQDVLDDVRMTPTRARGDRADR